VQKEKDAAANSIKGLRIENSVGSMLSGLSTIYDDLDPQVKNMTIRNILAQAQGAKEYEFILTDAGTIDLQKKDGTKPYTENHQLVTAKDFIEATLANAKILKRQQQGPADNGGNNNQQQPGQPGKVDAGGQNVNKTLAGLVAASQKDLQTSQVTPIF
jgi:hypothetical protein